jgi:hypothetical protein
MLPGFHLQTLRRKPRSAQQKFADEIALLKQKSFKQIGEVFEKFIPRTLLKPEQSGDMSRRRIFSKENTFWAFFSQMLDADGGCKEVIRKLQQQYSVTHNTEATIQCQVSTYDIVTGVDLTLSVSLYQTTT